MTAFATASQARPAAGPAWLARRVVDTLGGRYSTALGIDLDAEDTQAERWFLAATLFGTRTTDQIAERTFRVLTSAGLTGIAQARYRPADTILGYLREGGYAHSATQIGVLLHDLSEIIGERYDGQVALIGQRHATYPGLRTALGVLPGWGPVTIQLFLRELRGVWPGAQPQLDARAEYAARHLDLTGPDLPAVAQLAAAAHTDLRDLESGLVRLTFAHHRRGMDRCPGGSRCAALAP
jgi:hypothetical protein